MAKLPGKTAYSGRRRAVTRKSGNSTQAGSTGGVWRSEVTTAIPIAAGTVFEITLDIPPHEPGAWVGFGGWYHCAKTFTVELSSPTTRTTLTQPAAPNWSKFGSMWRGTGEPCSALLRVHAAAPGILSVWDLGAGVVAPPACHSGGEVVECTEPGYLTNLHQLSPEAHFWVKQGRVSMATAAKGAEVGKVAEGAPLTTKVCNRCGRFLPINLEDECLPLSFSNHCKANHPCKHPLFGRLKNQDTGEVLQLEYGFQLECRYCKKFCVNAAHNAMRTASQMKEDGARRRHFELLISELFQMSAQMAFKHRTGKELADYIWEKFARKCFNCDEPLATPKHMHLDHTRPLALLWPLDETATALCGPCNSSKSDRFPGDFYTKPGKLRELSAITGIPLEELEHPSPNMQVIDALADRLDWFFDNFLARPEMMRERDGKVTGELVVKALQKAVEQALGGPPFDLVKMHADRVG